MDQLIKHIDGKTLDTLSNNKIAYEYLAFKKQQTQATQKAVSNTAFFGVLGGLACIDFGLSFITFLFVGDSLAQACADMGKNVQKSHFKTVGRKHARLENFAGQMVEGRVEDLLSLMALQEVMLGFEFGAGFIQTASRDKDTRAQVEERMRSIAQNVTVPHYGMYKILKTRDDVRKFNLLDTVKRAKNPQQKMLKRMMRRKA